MTFWKRTPAMVAAALAVLTASALGMPSPAEAHGRGVAFRRRPTVFFGGFSPFYSPYFNPYFAYGFSPYGFGPYGGPFGPPAGLEMGIAAAAGVGGIDLNVKPGQAEVWIDGKFVAEARDLDGTPSFLWLKEGAHRVAVYKGGYAIFDEEIEVRRGVLKELKVRLEPGEATPPGQRTDKGQTKG
jgi:PEGA domain-containing protein